MKMSPSLTSYPVFPDWVFEGRLEIDDHMTDSILSDIKSVKNSSNVFTETNFGWITNKSIIPGKNMLNINRLIHSLFVNNISAHYQLADENNIELCDTWALGITKSHIAPVNVERHRWYQSVLYLQADDNSSTLYFDQFGPKLYSTPIGVQPYTHYIKPEKNKIIFFPAHLPWGFTPNASNANTILLCTSFIIKKS